MLIAVTTSICRLSPVAFFKLALLLFCFLDGLSHKAYPLVELVADKS